MNFDELMVIGDIWYNRTIKLKIIWQDVNQPDYILARAFYLFMKMKGRLEKIIGFSIDMSKISNCKFEIGGI